LHVKCNNGLFYLSMDKIRMDSDVFNIEDHNFLRLEHLRHFFLGPDATNYKYKDDICGLLRHFFLDPDAANYKYKDDICGLLRHFFLGIDHRYRI
jgi:hypothetical protein